MDLKHLSDDAVLNKIKNEVQSERTATANVLHYLREVDRRRLYSKLKCKCLVSFAIKYLKYSESEAWLRVSAMKLLNELPEIESKINDGSLQLSNIVLARRAFFQESKANNLKSAAAETNAQGNLVLSETSDQAQVTPVQGARTSTEKLAVLQKLENVSKSQAKKIIAQETGVKIQGSESVRELSNGKVELKTIHSKETLQNIERLKGVLAHSNPNISTSELIDLAIAKLCEKVDPLAKAKRVAARKAIGPDQKHRVEKCGKPTPRDYIPSTVRHHVRLRDQGQCTNCGSTHAVQFEHMVPVAMGGENTIANLKLLCRNCNQRAAIASFGVHKMVSYLKNPTIHYQS
ncbi:MAG: HNH endonuclease [Bdellovibrionota bacterium]